MTDEVYYRYEGAHYAPPLDEYENPIGSGQRVLRLDKYEVLKRTPKGVWLAHYINGRRFVLDSARKRFACPTPAEALESFRQRKLRQARILGGQLADVHTFLNLADKEPTQ